MPIYEFRCTSCGHQFELMQSFDKTKKVACPLCGEPSKKLLSTGTGFIMNGEGFSQDSSAHRFRSQCDRSSPCCGSEEPCTTPPCEN